MLTVIGVNEMAVNDMANKVKAEMDKMDEIKRERGRGNKVLVYTLKSYHDLMADLHFEANLGMWLDGIVGIGAVLGGLAWLIMQGPFAGPGAWIVLGGGLGAVVGFFMMQHMNDVITNHEAYIRQYDCSRC